MCCNTEAFDTVVVVLCVCAVVVVFCGVGRCGGGGGAACCFLTFLPHISSRDEKLDSLK